MPVIRGCDFPDDLSYDPDLNLWLKLVSPGEWQVGITQFGGALVGDIYMFNPKPLGRDIEAGHTFALIEVAKTIITVKAPFDATLILANEEVQERPVRIIRKPYESWLVHLRAHDPQRAQESLLSGQRVIERATELMDLNGFTALEEFKKSKGMIS